MNRSDGRITEAAGGRAGGFLAVGILGALVAAAGIWVSRGADPAPAVDPGRAGLPVGGMAPFAGPAAMVPEAKGWMLCDGRELAVEAYPDLYAVIGTAWGGAPGGGRFRIPDLRGRFLRGVNYAASGEAGDPEAALRTAAAPGGNAGNEVGSVQEDGVGGHVHPLAGAADATGQGAGGEWVRFHGLKVPDDTAPVVTNYAAVAGPGGLETRPRNAYVNWIIRVR